jgi:hypothetical protein
MLGQEISPQTEGSSGHGAAHELRSPKMRRFAGAYFFFLPRLTRVTVSG